MKCSLHDLLGLAQTNSLVKTRHKVYFGSRWMRETVYVAKVDDIVLTIRHIQKRIFPKNTSQEHAYFS